MPRQKKVVHFDQSWALGSRSDASHEEHPLAPNASPQPTSSAMPTSGGSLGRRRQGVITLTKVEDIRSSPSSSDDEEVTQVHDRATQVDRPHWVVKASRMNEVTSQLAEKDRENYNLRQKVTRLQRELKALREDIDKCKRNFHTTRPEAIALVRPFTG